MACITVPIPAIPTLPSPLSLSLPPLPPIPGLPEFCCKLPPIELPPIPIEVPTTVITPAVIATLNGFITQANNYLAALPFDCPLED